MHKLNILHIAPDFHYNNGRAQYVYNITRSLSAAGHTPIVLTNRGDSTERLNKNNILYYEFENLHTKNILNYYSILRDICDRHNIDIIHTHHRRDDFYLYLCEKVFSFKKLNCLSVISIKKDRVKMSYFAKNIIAVSRAVSKNLTIDFKISDTRINLLPNYILKVDYKVTKKDYDNKKIRIFSAGRFDPEKNYETLIKGIGLSKYKNDIEFVLIGKGKMQTEYERLISELIVNVTILPPQKSLDSFFNDSDICILSSTVDPFPYFMLISGYFGKPFIGSRVDGIGELIQDNMSGYLFESGNENMLAEKIDYVIENYDKAKAAAKVLQNEVSENYTAEKIFPELEKYYYNILERF